MKAIILCVLLFYTFTSLVNCVPRSKVNSNVNVVFVGDSITYQWRTKGEQVWEKYWAPLGAKDVGVSGDTTEQTLDRINNHGLVDNIRPKVAVLMIGTNNLENPKHDSDEVIAQQIKQIIDTLKQKLPGVKVLLLGVLPRSGLDLCIRIEHINSLISKYDDAKTVRFLDMTTHFETARNKLINKLYQPGGLHLTQAGYQVWAQVMDPLLEQMLKN